MFFPVSFVWMWGFFPSRFPCVPLGVSVTVPPASALVRRNAGGEGEGRRFATSQRVLCLGVPAPAVCPYRRVLAQALKTGGKKMFTLMTR